MRVTPESLQETQPLVHPSGPVIVFDGRLDNREELLGLLRGNWGAEQDSPDPALVLAAYEAFGDRCPERLNGDFALAIYDPRKQQLLLARDALGVRPLYYHRIGDTFLFASEIKAILAHPKVSPRPNDEAIAEFILWGPEKKENTFFTGVFSLPPAHQALLTPNGFVVRRYWDFDTNKQIRYRSFSDYVEAFRHIFSQAVGRRLRSAYPVAIQVSGGLDSSSIFCQAETMRRIAPDKYPRLLGLNLSIDDGSLADERSFVTAIEEAYGVCIQRLPLAPVRFMDGIERVTWHQETPILDLQWKDADDILKASRQSGAKVLLTGHWGDDVLMAWGYLLDLFHRGARSTVWAHLNEFHLWNIDVITPRAFLRKFVRSIIKYHIPEAVRQPLRRLRGKLSPPIWKTRDYAATLAIAKDQFSAVQLSTAVKKSDK